MRRPKGSHWALSSASSAAQTVPLSHRSSQSTGSLRLLRLLAVVSVIGSQFHAVLCIASVEPTAAGAAATTSSQQQHSSGAGENHSFFFDDYNTTKTTSSTAGGYPATGASASTAALSSPTQDQYQSHSQSQSQSQSQMPAEEASATALDLSHFAINPGVRLDRASVKAAAGSNEISNSTPIKNLITSFGRPALMADDQQQQQLVMPGATATAAVAVASATTTTTTTLAATLKSAKSTIKQPIDSTRSRNHWTVGVGGGGSAARDTERPRTFRSKHHHEHHWGPFFEEPVNAGASGENLVSAVHLFTEAVLNCRVGMLKDKTVMWVRRTSEKVSLLTVGNVTYSGDPRIRVKFQYPNNWRLLINPTQTEDAGIYMCQVSTHPPRVFTTNLTILEPPLRIIDEHERDVGDRYYKSGSTVDLQCQISRNFFLKERYTILKSTETTKGGGDVHKLYNESSGEPNLVGNASQLAQLKLSGLELEKYFSKFITWTKDEEPLQGLTNKRSSISDKWLTSRISIEDAKLSDSGNYSCSLGRLFTVIVQVQVLTGELPAAVQHNIASRIQNSPAGLLVILLFVHISLHLAKN
ncbi:uncharacterized protein dpr18 [Drosophila kikkawai]|uniref:Uncharacterized protein dpr18 n=1 Tax=Drosophila kikkawai TaxID=30033 RepID=A0ABM4GMW6_DROKI